MIQIEITKKRKFQTIMNIERVIELGKVLRHSNKKNRGKRKQKKM